MSASLPKLPRRLLIIVAALAVIVGIAAAVWWPAGGEQAAPAASVAATASDTPTGSPSPTSSPSATAASAAGCTPVSEGFVPTRFAIPAMDVDEPIVSLNLDEDGNIAAPPLDEPRMASWWNAGPQPGAGKGQAVLSVHTYRNGQALGNELYAGGEPALEPGDVIALTGDDGQVMCYEFTEALKIHVDDYDPDSTVMVDRDGDPRLAMIICWDFDAPTEIWETRVFFYFTPVDAA